MCPIMRRMPIGLENKTFRVNPGSAMLLSTPEMRVMFGLLGPEGIRQLDTARQEPRAWYLAQVEAKTKLPGMYMFRYEAAGNWEVTKNWIMLRQQEIPAD